MMQYEKDTRSPSGFLGNHRADLAPFIEQAAQATGFDVYTGPAKGPGQDGYVGVYTSEGTRDLSPFWAEVERLAEAAETDGDQVDGQEA